MNTEKQNIEELQKAMHGAIDALFALRDAADKLKKKGAQAPSFAEGGINRKKGGEFFDGFDNGKPFEPDPHDFCANARANDMSNAEIGMAKEIEHLREENRELRESNERLRKENAELKDWNDKLNECCNLLESEVQMLKAKIFDIQNK